ncbi:MAG TPA: serine protease [Polyangiaceae bacterium]|nr:serine protease [Polyangiaceae bacterium]
MGSYRRSALHRWAAVALSLAAFTGCAVSPGAATLGADQEPFINGADNRLDYFQLQNVDERAAMQSFAVALMPLVNAQALVSGEVDQIPSWGQLNDLCADEPFRDQPSASFCSGVLVDWDLVLTSGHCMDLVPLEALRVVLGYYYTAPGQLALSSSDVYSAAEVVASRRDPSSYEQRLDFAWLRLNGLVQAPHHPAAVYRRSPGPSLGDPIISISAGGGIPLKLDDGAHVQETRETTGDYFVADTDTSEGSSGGGAFAPDLALLGTLARGAPDFVQQDSTCQVSDKSQNPNEAREQFTYLYRSIQDLCEVEPQRWLCDAQCAEPCLPPSAPLDPPSSADANCAIGAWGAGRTRAVLPLFCAVASLRRRRKRAERTGSAARDCGSEAEAPHISS